jgi:sugar O-acyltransferase (sialic acid O-acetyltransferase NeuD family)
MKRLSILGAGGHGKVVGDAADASGNWAEIAYYDDAWPQLKENGPWQVIGPIRSFIEKPSADSDVVVAIGNNALRAQLSTALLERDLKLVSVIHPDAHLSKYASIGPGTVIFAGAVVNIGADIGPACIINTGAIIEHDCVLGQAVHVSPGAKLAGAVTIGDASWVGIGACIRQQITIGHNVTIGAGAVVVSSLPDNVTAVGNPARIINRESSC